MWAVFRIDRRFRHSITALSKFFQFPVADFLQKVKPSKKFATVKDVIPWDKQSKFAADRL